MLGDTVCIIELSNNCYDLLKDGNDAKQCLSLIDTCAITSVGCIVMINADDIMALNKGRFYRE